MRVAGDDAEADAAEEGDAGVGPPAVPVFLAELEVFLSYILIIFYALQSGGGLMAPSASCFVGAPLYFIVPPSSTCTGRCENYVKKTERETKAKGLSPHARDNQLQVGSSGDPIRPLVAEILIIYLLIGRGGGKPLCLCGAVVAGSQRLKKNRKKTNNDINAVKWQCAH